MIGKTISHYMILEKLGGGGMGVVYKAEDTKLKRTVALKFLPHELIRDPDSKNRFIHEAQTASALQHNNICTIYDVDETDDGQMFICMEYYEGETLKKKIEREPLKVDDAINITTQIAQGLDKAHNKGIIHRDIKPANIMITDDGVVKITTYVASELGVHYILQISSAVVDEQVFLKPRLLDAIKDEYISMQEYKRNTKNILGLQGLIAKAIEVQKRSVELSPYWEWGLAYTYALAGYTEEALKIAKKLEERNDIWDTNGLAVIYSAIGDADKIFYWLNQAEERGHIWIMWMGIPGVFWDAYKEDPRYRDLAQRLNFPR